jgi:hypothetical protein
MAPNVRAARVVLLVNVAYPAEFLKKLNDQRAYRKARGEIFFEHLGDSELPNRLLVISHWGDLRQAQEFWRSDEAKGHIAIWNTVEPPIFSFYIGETLHDLTSRILKELAN